MHQLKKKPATDKERKKLAAAIKECRAIIQELRDILRGAHRSSALERLAVPGHGAKRHH